MVMKMSMTTMDLTAAMALAIAACFDPTVPPECTGAVCGEVTERPEDGGASPAGGGADSSTSAGGAAGAPGVGGAGGMGMGGLGGQGGMAPLAITITNPPQGAQLPHGTPIDFIAEVTGGAPANDQIVWQKSEVAGPFGIGYVHTKTINVIGTHTLSVAVMEGDNPVATDTITFETQ
jgi:hypothetical protein